jgi:regulator of cell morphogenesis and NO signaling
MPDIHRDALVGAVVARDLRTADVFRRAGIEFWCQGRQTLDQACAGADVDVDHLITELRAVAAEPDPSVDLTALPVPRLIDRLVSRHHHYVRAYVPIIREYLHRLADRHAEHHPEMARLAAVFDDVSEELLRHMDKEERLLFPIVERVATSPASPSHQRVAMLLDDPLTVMEDEHEWTVAQLALMRTLANDYTPPDRGGASWAACYAALDRFERDLHEHVSLENNVLFPLARALGGARRQPACMHDARERTGGCHG